MADASVSVITVDELLAETVRVYPVLYDKACQDFKDRNKKELAWQDVAQKAGFPSGTGHTRNMWCRILLDMLPL